MRSMNDSHGAPCGCLGYCALAMALFAGSAYGQSAFSTVVQTSLSCSTGAGTGEFTVISWSLSVQNNTNIASRDGRAGPAVLGPLQFVKALDSCTPALFGSAATGANIGAVTLNQTSSNVPLVTVQLTAARVISDQLGDTAPSAGPVETVSLSYDKIMITSHSSHGDTTFCYNAATASPC